MAKFTSADLGRRIAFDYRVAMPMRYKLMELSAHRKAKDARAHKNAISDPAEANKAKHYRIVYRIKTLVGLAKYHDLTVVHIDLLANGNYPFSNPSCWVISKPMPWSPHFKEGAPICIGDIWNQAKGEILLGHLLIHIAKLLNFDEEAHRGGYVGWNGASVRFWKKKFKERPITQGLTYPSLPLEITHGVRHRKTTPALFRPRGQIQLAASSELDKLFHPK
jgi:hypothetical protein